MVRISDSKVKFLLRMLVIFSIIIICDKAIGTILESLYFRQQSGTSYRTTYSIDSVKADVLVFGSSRASHSYKPEIFENKFSTSFYNTGKDGNFVLYNYGVFKAIIRRYSPEIVIFDISPGELAYASSEYERLSSLLPYYKSHPEIRRIVDLRGPFEKLKHLSSVYPYNSLVLMILMGNMESNKLRKPDYKGYVALNKTMKLQERDTFQNPIGNVDENKLNAFMDIISICKQKKIELIFVNSPLWNINNKDFCRDKFVKLCQSQGVRFFDFSNHPGISGNPDYFADINHLNDSGARIFSEFLTDSILRAN